MKNSSTKITKIKTTPKFGKITVLHQPLFLYIFPCNRHFFMAFNCIKSVLDNRFLMSHGGDASGGTTGEAAAGGSAHKTC